jgi:hypothetical protein
MRQGMLAVLAVALMAGCGSTTSQNSASSPAPASSPTPAKTAKPKPTHRSAPPSDGLTGYGATNAAWKAHHKADTSSGFIKGSAYDPDPALVRGGDPRDSDKYYAVQHEGGRIGQYQMRFPPGTDVAEAQRQVLASEFPSDAHGTLRTLDSCAIMNVKSAKVRKAIGLNAAVEFISGAGGETYDPNDVWGAIVSFGSFSEC